MNSGLIFGDSIGIDSTLPGTEIENTGEIRGGGSALRFSIGDDGVVNRGSLWGTVSMSSGNDTVDNRWGRIEGNVDLGFGDDTFDGRFGFVTGDVLGSAGNDTFRGNAALDEVFDGGLDIDTLGFRPGPKVIVALDGSIENGGAAAGDTYFNFENVNGSAFGDQIIGSDGENRLAGGGGVDKISGGAGADTLVGNLGADGLTGGTGDDQFLFNTLAERGDKITDFGAGLGNNDMIVIAAATFGGGLVPGALAAAQYRARADNVAQDADDLFIYRTTDATLWFDADGNGAGEAVMVANLQDTAVFTRADILLI